MTRIDQLPAGVPAIITAIDREACSEGVWRRLHEMGFDEGVDVEVLHRAPLGGDPIALRVGNMTIAIRRAEAALVGVELAANDDRIAPMPNTPVRVAAE